MVININHVGHHWKGFPLLCHMMYHVLHILKIGHFTTHFTNAPKLSQFHRWTLYCIFLLHIILITNCIFLLHIILITNQDIFYFSFIWDQCWCNHVFIWHGIAIEFLTSLLCGTNMHQPTHINKTYIFLNPCDVLNMKWFCSIENIGMQYLFWLYLYRFPYADHFYDFWRKAITILYIYKLPLYCDQYHKINHVGHH